MTKPRSPSSGTRKDTLWKLNQGDRSIALTKLVIKHANLHTMETEYGE